MRILHIYKVCFPVIGGIENHIDVLSRAQAERGHQVTVLACNPGDQEAAETIDGVEILRAPPVHRLVPADQPGPSDHGGPTPGGRAAAGHRTRAQPLSAG